MALFSNALICAALAAVLWSCIGFSVASRVVPPALAWPVAPLLGWALHSVVALPVFFALGMSRPAVAGVIAISVIAALAAMRLHRPPAATDRDAVRIPVWAIAGAALLAFAAMAAVVPKISAEGVSLAEPIFDHSKVAMIDEIARLGVPAGNPFFGEIGGPERLSYYYLWHFSAAELAILTGLSGWEADAGLTWFTAFASLMLMMGLASWIGARASSAAWVLALAATASIRPFVIWLLGWKITYAMTGWPSGFGGWIFQVTWAPQHVASAGCAVIAIILLVRLARRQSSLQVIILSLVVAAGFESSTWVGGVTFPLAAIVVGLVVIVGLDPRRRWSFLVGAAAAAVLAVALTSPFLYDQFRATALRGDGSPIAIVPFDVLGEQFPQIIRTVFDLPAYFLLFLFVELAAIYPVGIVMTRWLASDQMLSPDRKRIVTAFGWLAAVSLGVGALLLSTIGGNNDLAWRGVLPAIMALTIVTAAGLSRYLRELPLRYGVAALAMITLGVIDGLIFMRGNIFVQPQASAKAFADSASMWRAVRNHAGDAERVANNPLFLDDMTTWPVNISWALLANRRSCYAAHDLALPFAPVNRARREQVDAQFVRVFAGDAQPDDLRQLATQYNCDVAVITARDGAWNRDPFAASSLYSLVETNEPAWRIYKRRRDPN